MEKERYKSGAKLSQKIDTTPLTLDLDFLNATSLEYFEEIIDTSEVFIDDINSESDIIDTDSTKEYDYNYLME